MQIDGNMKTRLRLPQLTLCARLALIAGLTSIASAQPTLNLPPGLLTPTVKYSTSGTQLPALVTVQFSGIAAGYDIGNQTYLGWCVQPNADLPIPDANH